jgi:hypothetical protein
MNIEVMSADSVRPPPTTATLIVSLSPMLLCKYHGAPMGLGHSVEQWLTLKTCWRVKTGVRARQCVFISKLDPLFTTRTGINQYLILRYLPSQVSVLCCGENLGTVTQGSASPYQQQTIMAHGPCKKKKKIACGWRVDMRLPSSKIDNDYRC